MSRSVYQIRHATCGMDTKFFWINPISILKKRTYGCFIYFKNLISKKTFIFINNGENTDNSIDRYIDKDVDINDLICRTFVDTNTWKVFHSMMLE